MSYEYKALIEQAIIDDDRPLDWEEGFKELDEVYAKARAFDKALNKLKVVKNHPLMDEEKVEHYNLCYQLVAESILEVLE